MTTCFCISFKQVGCTKDKAPKVTTSFQGPPKPARPVPRMSLKNRNIQKYRKVIVVKIGQDVCNLVVSFFLVLCLFNSCANKKFRNGEVGKQWLHFFGGITCYFFFDSIHGRSWKKFIYHDVFTYHNCSEHLSFFYHWYFSWGVHETSWNVMKPWICS